MCHYFITGSPGGHYYAFYNRINPHPRLDAITACTNDGAYLLRLDESELDMLADYIRANSAEDGYIWTEAACHLDECLELAPFYDWDPGFPVAVDASVNSGFTYVVINASSLRLRNEPAPSVREYVCEYNSPCDSRYTLQCYTNGVCAPNTAACVCNAGFTGFKCRDTLNVCAPDLCSNAGTCYESPSGRRL